MHMWGRGFGSAYGALHGGAEGHIQTLSEQEHKKMICVKGILTVIDHLYLVLSNLIDHIDTAAIYFLHHILLLRHAVGGNGEERNPS